MEERAFDLGLEDWAGFQEAEKGRLQQREAQEQREGEIHSALRQKCMIAHLPGTRTATD